MSRRQPSAARGAQDKAAAATVAAAKNMKISDSAVSNARRAGPGMMAGDIFRPYEPAPGVLPKNTKPKIAQDDAYSQAMNWAGAACGQYGGAGQSGMNFIGYAELAVLAQRAEYRLITETIAEEMTREWIEIRAKGDEDKSDKIAAIEAAMKRLNVQRVFRQAAEKDGYFGRGHVYLDFGAPTNSEELATPIGAGGESSKAKIAKGTLKALRIVEPMWTYPSAYNSNDPLSPTWYNPETWYVMGRAVSATRLLTFIGHEVPDILKPAYAFGGLSMTQMAKPYVDNWLRTRQSVADIVQAFTVFVLKTNMASVLGGEDGANVFNRVDMFNATRDNRGTMVVDKETEDFANVSASLAGLHELQAQAQEHMASVSKLPLVKLTGISPSGLNASSDGELRCFNDTIKAAQERLFRPNLETVLRFIQLSEFGEVDPDISFTFRSIYQMTEKENAEIRKMDAETGNILIDDGSISPEEERRRVASDPGARYDGLDPDDAPDLAEEEAGGLVIKGAKGMGESD